MGIQQNAPNKSFNVPFHEKLESIQYNACLALTGAIRGISKDKIYQELDPPMVQKASPLL